MEKIWDQKDKQYYFKNLTTDIQKIGNHKKQKILSKYRQLERITNKKKWFSQNELNEYGWICGTLDTIIFDDYIIQKTTNDILFYDVSKNTLKKFI